MKQKIIIKNFGPIEDVEMEIDDFTIFIGPQTSGKSTIANLLHESLGIPILDIDFLLEKKINYSLQDFINNWKMGCLE